MIGFRRARRAPAKHFRNIHTKKAACGRPVYPPYKLTDDSGKTTCRACKKTNAWNLHASRNLAG